MIVLDASAIVELLLGTAQGRAIGARIADPALGLHVPHLLDIEVAQAPSRASPDEPDSRQRRKSVEQHPLTVRREPGQSEVPETAHARSPRALRT